MTISRHKLGLLGSLYFSQGLPYGFFVQALPVLLRQAGASLPVIGLTSLLAFPWAFKFLWAPLIDRFDGSRFGRRRGWILPLQAIGVVFLAGMGLVEPQNGLLLLAVGTFLTNLVAATQDIATDGLAVDLLDPEERGHGNAIQVAGYRVGMIVGGGAMLIVFQRAGWSSTFLSMAVLLGLATIPVALFTERSTSRGRVTGVGFGRIVTFLTKPGIGLWFVVLFTYKFGEHMASAMAKPLLVDLGCTMELVGWIVGTSGSVAGLAGALIGGHLASRWGRRRAVFVCGLIQSMAAAGYALPALGAVHPVMLFLVCGLEHLASGMATVSLFTTMMDACDKGTEATDYTVQACLVVIATGAAGALSGFSARALGYPLHFALSTLMSLSAAALASAVLGSGRLPFVPLEPNGSQDECLALSRFQR